MEFREIEISCHGLSWDFMKISCHGVSCDFIMALPFVQVAVRPTSPSAQRPRRCARRPTNGWSSLRTRRRPRHPRRRPRRRGRWWSWHFATRGMRSGADGRQIPSNIEDETSRGVGWNVGESCGNRERNGDIWPVFFSAINQLSMIYYSWISWENHLGNQLADISKTTNRCTWWHFGTGKMMEHDRLWGRP